jgi:hypothetical protein
VLNGGVGWGAAGVFFVSLSLQTHLSFVPVAGIAALVLLVGTAWGCAHLPRSPGDSWWHRWRALLGGEVLAAPDLPAPCGLPDAFPDGLVAVVKRDCPTCVLVSPVLADLQAGRCQRSAAAMETVADHYRIPSVHFGPEVAKRIAAGTLVFKGEKPEPFDPAALPMLFSTDGVHPLVETGHGLYTDVLTRSLEAIEQAGQGGEAAIGRPVDDPAREQHGQGEADQQAGDHEPRQHQDESHRQAKRQARGQHIVQLLAGGRAVLDRIPFVEGDQDGAALALDQPGDAQILLIHPQQGVDHQDHHLGLLQRADGRPGPDVDPVPDPGARADRRGRVIDDRGGMDGAIAGLLRIEHRG